MHRFIVTGDWHAGDEVTFPREEAAHAFRVLRLSRDDDVEISNGSGRLFAATMTEVSRERVCARVTGELDGHESPVRLTLYQGFPKAEKLDLIVQKLTELGAARIVPVMMSRSVVRLDAKDGERRRQRLERIAQEAAKQCGRSRVPDISAPISWNDALEAFQTHELMLVPWEEAQNTRLADLKNQFPQARDIALLIGPEGGISAREAEQAAERGAHSLTLGPRILRAETAAIASAAVTMAYWGDI